MVRQGRLSLLAVCLCSVPLLCVGDTPATRSASESATDAEAPPAGYRSMAAIKLAFLTGQLKLVDRNIAVPATVSVRRSVEYGTGGGESLKLDLYAPKRPGKPVPGLIFIHGGAWKKGFFTRICG